MALSNFLTHANVGHKKLCRFEIRLDDNFIFLRGTESETPDFDLSGSVVLMTSETIQTKGIAIDFFGKRRTMHFLTDEKDKPSGISTNTPIVNKGTFLDQRQRLRLNGQEIRTLKPGNYELPFTFKLPGNISESIEGLPGSFIVYDLKATLDKGLMAKDLLARKHVRIIRTLGQDPVELVDPQQVSGFWPDKLKYEFTTSSRAAIFGTKVVTNIELTPLVEKLRIGKIRVTLKEVRKVRTVPGPEALGGMWKTEVSIKEEIMDLPEGCSDQDPQLQLPMFRFKSVFELPKSLTQCRQSVENNEWIKIKHVMYYDVLLHNPDGHLSELRAHHAIKLFVSPNLPVGDDNAVGSNSGQTSPEEHLLEDLQQAPPDYSHHRLDPLYDGVDVNGFMTPFPTSGAATPGLSFSRRGSDDHALTLNQAANGFHEDLTQRLAGLPDQHQDNDIAARLLNLQVHQSDNDHQSPHSGAQSSGAPTRSNSCFDLASLGSSGVHSPNDAVHFRTVDYDSDALSRMPSYETAVKAPTTRAQRGDLPPTYHAE